jgi:hypothetical protein
MACASGRHRLDGRISNTADEITPSQRSAKDENSIASAKSAAHSGISTAA